MTEWGGLGEKNPRAKLTEDRVREIRQRIAAGELQIEVAASFGVSVATINKIVHRQTWRHVK